MATLGNVIQEKERLEDDLVLHITPSEEYNDCVLVDCSILKRDAQGNLFFGAEQQRWPLLEVSPNELTIYPFEWTSGTTGPFRAKYDGIDAIIVSCFKEKPYKLPEDEFDVYSLLSDLPVFFERKLANGLGFHRNDRFICEVIGSIPNISTILVHDGRPPEIVGNIYFIALEKLKQLSKAMKAISGRYQRNGRRDRHLLAHNELLTTIDPEQFPKKEKTLQSNVVVELLQVPGTRTKLQSQDQRAAVKLVLDNTRELAQREPQVLFELKADIERVTLAELIIKFEELLSKSLEEAKWQAFFEVNPFILSMVFPVPVMILQGRPYVGGQAVHGASGKYSDFLCQAASTGNAALIEIKKPGVKLLEPYRPPLSGPSRELCASVSQIMDQRSKLYLEFTTTKYKGGDLLKKLRASSIQCLVIAGRNPTDEHEQDSLELYRNSLRDVTVVTFDEVLNRLKSIQEVLSEKKEDDVPF